jgi:hypothetical protein
MTKLIAPSVIGKKNLPNNGKHPPAIQQWSSGVRLCIVAPTEHPGHFSAEVNGELIVQSSGQPFCDAARMLVERGCDTNSTLIMRHAGSDTNCLIGKIGIAAKLTVAEGERDAPR